MRTLALCLALAGPAAAQQQEVDVELLLLVDVSRSMSAAELDLQRQGYAEALTSDPVVEAIGGGMTGRIALAYVEWAGEGLQRVVVDWTLIEGEADLAGFAGALTAGPSFTQSRTSISGALRFGAAYLGGNGYDGLRQVIDISGDGPNNQGAAGRRDARRGDRAGHPDQRTAADDDGPRRRRLAAGGSRRLLPVLRHRRPRRLRCAGVRMARLRRRR